MFRKVITGIAVATLTVLGSIAAPTAANAGGSDSPTPYSVTESGITLPAGDVFRDNGHVNIKTSGGARGLHFEGKCVIRTDAECAGQRHDAAQFIGQTTIPWSAFGLSGEFCVTWVQISQYNEHFGEGGQPSVCVGEKKTPTPEVPLPDPEVRWESSASQIVCEDRTVVSTFREEARGFFRGQDGAVYPGDWTVTGETRTESRAATTEECPTVDRPTTPTGEQPETPEKPVAPVIDDPQKPGGEQTDPVSDSPVESERAETEREGLDDRDRLPNTGADDALLPGALIAGLVATGLGLVLLSGGVRRRNAP